MTVLVKFGWSYCSSHGNRKRTVFNLRKMRFVIIQKAYSIYGQYWRNCPIRTQIKDASVYSPSMKKNGNMALFVIFLHHSLLPGTRLIIFTKAQYGYDKISGRKI